MAGVEVSSAGRNPTAKPATTGTAGPPTAADDASGSFPHAPGDLRECRHAGQKIAFHRQLADPPVQIVDGPLHVRLAALPRPEYRRRLRGQLVLPCRDQRRMNPELRRQLRQRLAARQRRQRYPRLEFRCVPLANPFTTRHRSSPYLRTLSLRTCPKIRGHYTS